MVYDNAEKEVTVTVTNDNGTLKAVVDSEPAFKNVFKEPFTSSTKGSFKGNLRDPHNTECSKMCATPVLSCGGVRNATWNTLLESSA